MNIADRIEGAIKGIIPVFAKTPEFTAENEPERYAVYSLTERGREYAEGEEHSIQYFVSLSVFTEELDFLLYAQLRAAMKGAGFGYDSGGQVDGDSVYPYGTHYYLDFTGVE